VVEAGDQDDDYDDYDDFRDLEWNDKASSLRYFIPPAHAVVLHDADNFQVGENEPTIRLKVAQTGPFGDFIAPVATCRNATEVVIEVVNQGVTYIAPGTGKRYFRAAAWLE
jgi:hypothetical protein